jgi:hypothetical protein
LYTIILSIRPVYTIVEAKVVGTSHARALATADLYT